MTAKARRAPRRRAPPLDVDLSVSFRFGDAPEDRVVVLQDRRVPLIGTVFDRRDDIIRGFGKLLVKAALLRPAAAAEFLPFFKTLTRRRRGRAA